MKAGRLLARLRSSSGRTAGAGGHGGQALLHNLGASFLLQVANYLFPLIQLPYLARVLGVEGLGLAVFIMGLVAYFAVLIDWGFPLGATGQVARNRKNLDALGDIFWTTLLARTLLLLLAGLLLAGFALLPIGRPHVALLAWGGIALLAATITPDWYFQGLERMVMLSGVAFAGRVVTLGLVFALVRGEADVWKYLAITGGVSVLAALATLFYGRHLLPPLRRVSLGAALKQISDFRHFFLTRASILAYTMSAPVVLALVSGPIATGIYGGAERISRAALAFLNQASSVLFPRVSVLIADDQIEAVAMIRRLAAIQMVITSLASLFMFLAAKPIIMILLGSAFLPSVPVMQYLAWLPLLVGASNILGIQIMIPLRMERDLFHISLFSAAAFLILLGIAGSACGARGAAASLLLVELLVVLLQAYVLWRRHQTFCKALVKGLR